jgi:hypothetical protein
MKLQSAIHGKREMLPKCREEEGTIIFNPKVTSGPDKVVESVRGVFYSESWLQIFGMKPVTITTSLDGL